MNLFSTVHRNHKLFLESIEVIVMEIKHLIMVLWGIKINCIFWVLAKPFIWIISFILQYYSAIYSIYKQENWRLKRLRNILNLAQEAELRLNLNSSHFWTKLWLLHYTVQRRYMPVKVTQIHRRYSICKSKRLLK